MIAYYDPNVDRQILHQPGYNHGSPMTVCGKIATSMKLVDRPDHWAGIYCADCFIVREVA